jgi:hydroxymethylbilane synthase
MSPPIVRIGTRGSDLALWQARHISSLLARRAGLDAELVIVRTSGDHDRSRALHRLPGSGFFTRELQQALFERRVDAVVHSLKDLPIEEPNGLTLAAVCERADPRDLLIARQGWVGTGGMGLRSGARLGTSSLRRAAQALSLQPDLAVAPLRGNVPTRLLRLREGRFDAIVVAKAGVDRLALSLDDLVVQPLALGSFLPAPAQGALAVEVRADDDRVLETVRVLHDPSVAEATWCERALLKGMGGGCHLPLGAFAHHDDGDWVLSAAWGEIDDALTSATVRRVTANGHDAAGVVSTGLELLRGGVPA